MGKTNQPQLYVSCVFDRFFPKKMLGALKSSLVTENCGKGSPWGVTCQDARLREVFTERLEPQKYGQAEEIKTPIEQMFFERHI